MRTYKLEILIVEDKDFYGKSRELSNLNVKLSKIQNAEIVLYKGKKRSKILQDRFSLFSLIK